MESGLGQVAAKVENRQQLFGLRLLSLPLGDQAKEVVGAASGIGKRLESALGHSGRTESTIVLEAPEALDATTLVEGRSWLRMNRMPTGSSGYAAQTGMGGSLCPCPNPSQTSSGRSRERSGPKPSAGRGRITARNYMVLDMQHPYRAVAGNPKRLASHSTS
jgi:hypothetical protein